MIMKKEIEESKALKRKYMRTFDSHDGVKVLADLRNRCNMDVPINNEVEEGMRRVYLHIQTMISPEDMEEDNKEE